MKIRRAARRFLSGAALTRALVRGLRPRIVAEVGEQPVRPRRRVPYAHSISAADAEAVAEELGELGVLDARDRALDVVRDAEDPQRARRLVEDAELLDEESSDPEIQLDLARAYISMGDKEAARVILEEVVNNGSEAQQAEARKMLGFL